MPLPDRSNTFTKLIRLWIQYLRHMGKLSLTLWQGIVLRFANMAHDVKDIEDDFKNWVIMGDRDASLGMLVSFCVLGIIVQTHIDRCKFSNKPDDLFWIVFGFVCSSTMYELFIASAGEVTAG
jgi:hypothetical protein